MDAVEVMKRVPEYVEALPHARESGCRELAAKLVVDQHPRNLRRLFERLRGVCLGDDESGTDIVQVEGARHGMLT
jgi:hypothetical protein